MYLVISLISNTFPCHSWNSSKYLFSPFGMTSVENGGYQTSGAANAQLRTISSIWSQYRARTRSLIHPSNESDEQNQTSQHHMFHSHSQSSSRSNTAHRRKKKLHTWKQPHPDQLTPNENFCRRSTPAPPHVWQENKDRKKKIKALLVSPVLIRSRLSPVLVRAQQQWIQIGTDWLLPTRKSSRAVRCSGLVKSHTHRYAHWGRKCLLTIKASM